MLNLTLAQIQQIQAHAEACYPQECCGLLLGISQGCVDQPQRIVSALQSTENAWDNQGTATQDGTDNPDATLTAQRRYTIAPQDILQAQKYARLQGWDIIGVYHSHPDQAAVPSECDRQGAWPQYSYLIVSVLDGRAGDCQSWVLDHQQRFQPEVLMFTEEAFSAQLPTAPAPPPSP